MTPLNIKSAFRKTGIHPLSRKAISAKKLITCEGFREASPVCKVAALKDGKYAVLTFLFKKRKRHNDIKEMQHLPNRNEMPFVQQYKTTGAQTKVTRTRNYARLV